MTKPLTRRDWIGFLGMVVGIFMAVLDIQIVASSIKEIQAGISASQDEVAWVQTAYLIAEVIIIPLSGWLSRALSTRLLFFASCAVFTLMSLGCALAWDLHSMIAFRALQGLFGGAMIPTVFAVIYTMFPPRMQPMMSVLVGLIVTIAPTAGPVLGGYLTESFGWRSLFMINLLPGVLICCSTWLCVKVDQPEWSLLKRIDFTGIVLVALFLASLQYVMEEGANDGWLDDPVITRLSIVCAMSGIGMLVWELRQPHPIVDLKAFNNQNFALGCFLSFILGVGLYTVVYLIPLYLGSVKALNSLQIGQYMMITGSFQLLSAGIAGPLSKRMDLRSMLALGLLLFSLGTWLNSELSFDAGYAEFFLPQAVRGLALMFCFLPINTIALGTLDPADVKNASGLYNLMRNLGGALGLAVVNTLMLSQDKAHYAGIRESITLGNPIVIERLQQMQAALALRPEVDNPQLAALALLDRMAWRDAHIMTFNDLFSALSLLFLLALLAVPWLRPVKPGDIPAE